MPLVSSARRQPKAITSLQNERIKAIHALRMRKARRETGLFIAEGASLLITAREQGFVPETLIYRAGAANDGVARGLVAWALKEGAEVLEVTEKVLGKLADKDNPQTILGVFRQRWASPPDPRRLGPGDLWLALEEVRDPGNAGSIVRTVDAAGAAGIILTGACCDPYAPECVRASMGSIFPVPLVKMNRTELLAHIAAWPGDVVGTHLSAHEDFRNAACRPPILLLMGSEGPGLSDELAAACTRLVKIPMAGRLDSLNLAIATALVLYHLRGPFLKLERA